MLRNKNLKMITRILLIIIICLNGGLSFGQNYDSFIVGKWQNILRERIDGKKTNPLNKKFIADYKWEFSTKSFIDHFSPRDSSFGQYRINKNILIIGITEYKIEKLTKDELILVDMDPFSNKRNYFKKVKRFNY